MASSPVNSTDDSLHEPPGSPPTGLKTSSEDGTRKLGDFTKLSSQSLSLWAARKDTEVSDKPTTLGNFKRLFDQLGVKDPKIPTPLQQTPSPLTAGPITILKRPPQLSPDDQPAIMSNKELAESAIDIIVESETGSGSDTDLRPVTSYSTAASTPPSSAESPLENFARTKHNKSKTPKKTKTHSRGASKSKNVTRGGIAPGPERTVLSYQYVKYGPLTEIREHAPSAEAKHETLMGELIQERVVDSMVCKEFPNLASSGIHVFIDMSNIIIGFQKALRAKYSLPESARFVPLPQLNLTFFHELLARDRHIECLNVGCSMHPDRGEPTFIQELKDLGYRVDLRHRRPEQASTERPIVEAGGFRYVEDMVDETLQIRIGESVMQYFDRPGTLVLATGDARPAKYSDGFLAYAQRALKMGWSVEVLSWKSSLSSAWKGSWIDESIGSRFRVIELDQFLDQLWIC
ncbi:hypothetical protein ACJ41O_014686 [Fusarium nematophilum]